MDNKKTILFLHIPKTAGLTVSQSMLPRLFHGREIFTTKFTSFPCREKGRGVGIIDPELKSSGLFFGTRLPNDLWYPHSLAKVKEALDRQGPWPYSWVRLIHGAHIVYGLHETLALPMSYFTILRDPVDRVLSHYYYGGAERLKPSDPGFFSDLAEYVEANLQTRLLAGEQDPAAPLSPEAMLARAQENLRACAVVGLTERFDESLLLFRREYGWPMPYYERRNVNPRRLRREKVPDLVLRRIEADNGLDVSLYTLAVTLFESRVQSYGPGFQRDLQRFRAANRRWQRWRKFRAWFLGIPKAIGRVTFDPLYHGLARWGGLRRLVPARLSPRVVTSLENGRLFIDLKMGERLVGAFDPRRQRWEIRRPYHLLLDVRALPLAKGLGKNASPPGPAGSGH